MWLPLAHPLLRTWPATRACGLTGNWTCNPLFQRPALNPLNYASQGLKILFILFLERGEGWEKEREREGNIQVWLPLTCPLLGTWPATQARAPTGNQMLCRTTLNQLSYIGQGYPMFTNSHWYCISIPSQVTCFWHMVFNKYLLVKRKELYNLGIEKF